MKYIKLFPNEEAYWAYRDDSANFVAPNISKCSDSSKISYHKITPKNNLVICQYLVTDEDIENEYEIPLIKSGGGYGDGYGTASYYMSMEIDGVKIDEILSTYRFETAGIHTVKLRLIDNINSIGPAAFADTHLKSIIIPNQIEFIEDYTFNGCTSLETIVLPDTIKLWGTRSFQECNELINLNIPDSLEEIRGESKIMESPWFSNYVQNENNFDNGILYIGNVAYTTEYNAISYARHISDDSLLVQGEIRFKEGTIGISPDLGLPHQLITSVIIPDSIKFIGDDVFGNTLDETLSFPNITGITILATTPPKVSEQWPGGMFGKHETYPIYVPAESVDAYKTADIWSNYASRIFAIQS